MNKIAKHGASYYSREYDTLEKLTFMPHDPLPPSSRPPPPPLIQDAAPDSWVNRRAPFWSQPWLRLMRVDRPVGVWLLMLPCWWSIALAASVTGHMLPDFFLLMLFALGAFIMRAAGCVWNDLLDRDLDSRVERTQNRPLASGQVSPEGALILLGLLLLGGLIILLQFNGLTIALGIFSLILVALYPLAKRYIRWPQAVLGFTFNWGALMGWSAVTGELSIAPVLLYVAAFAWTIGYDTIYAHQDKEDDALIGIKSSALVLGKNTKPWLAIFYTLTIIGLFLVGPLMQLGLLYYVGLIFAGWHLIQQITGLDIDNRQDCLVTFRSNRDFGLVVFFTIMVGIVNFT